VYVAQALLLAVFYSTTAARPVRHELTNGFSNSDLVGHGQLRAGAQARKVQQDTIWIADWSFDSGSVCDDSGWERVDNRILNDGEVFWQVNSAFSNVGGIAGNAAVLGTDDGNPCCVFPGGYANDWYQAVRIEYTGSAATLSFDYLLDSEPRGFRLFDFMQVEADSACASFSRVNYDVAPDATAAAFRQQLHVEAGLNLAGSLSLDLPQWPAGETHCVYLSFISDSSISGCDGNNTIGKGLVIDNIQIAGESVLNEDFEDAVDPNVTLVNLHDAEPFGEWARLYGHATDNDFCSENTTCGWLFTDHTTPTIANDPSTNFGPNSFVVRNWLDNVILSPWVTIPDLAAQIVFTFREFPGNFFANSRIVRNWSVRGKNRIDNTETPVLGDSLDCVSGWGHAGSFNSLNRHEWVTWPTILGPEPNPNWNLDLWLDFIDSDATQLQLRFRVSDWQYLVGATPPSQLLPGPGPYVDRVRIGQIAAFTGPVIDPGIDDRSQAQDAFPTEIDPSITPGTGEHHRPTTSRFGTAAFSAGRDLGIKDPSAALITADSVVVIVGDARQTGAIIRVEWYGAIVSGPHAGKAPPPWNVAENGFFVVPADSARNDDGTLAPGLWFVDLDDDYLRGGDVLRCFWLAEDAQAGFGSYPPGLSAIPETRAEAEALTGGLLEVNVLPTIEWDPGYLARIAADPHGKLEPTPAELANSAQANCILYYTFSSAQRTAGNRTAFMYTLDRLGYGGRYDVYETSGLGNTNNQLGGRATVEQARGYALIIQDSGQFGPSVTLLPDGSDFDSAKIDQATWYRNWLETATLSDPGTATLWLVGSRIAETGATNALIFRNMGATVEKTDIAIDLNPDVVGQGSYTFAGGSVGDFSANVFALDGGCPDIREYNGLGATGNAVVTHRFRSGPTLYEGAAVMNSNAGESWNTILTSFPWHDIRDPDSGPEFPQPEDQLLSTILTGVLPVDCLAVQDPTTDAGDPGGPGIPPLQTSLHQNVPNPFNPTTMIRFDLAEHAHVELRIFDVSGRQVRTLVNQSLDRKRHTVVWDGRDDAGVPVSSGVYFYRLEAGSFSTTRKMVVMK
jgi:hypothetical protein